MSAATRTPDVFIDHTADVVEMHDVIGPHHQGLRQLHHAR
jgi:hypothetical protein